MPASKNQIAATVSREEAAKVGVIDAGRATEVITSNSRKQYGFTRKMLPTGLPTEPKLYIYSVSEYGEIVNLGPGFPLFEVKPCPEDETYGPPLAINPVYFFEEAKVDVTEHTFHSGQQIVEAILKIGPGMNASWDKRRWGWFVSASNPPTEEEVAGAVALYTQNCTRLLNEGNRYAAANQLTEINETHRRAAKYLGQRVDWDKPTRKMVDCIGCSERIPAGTKVHAVPYCGAIQNPTFEGWAEAIELGIKKLSDAPEHIQAQLKKSA